MSQTFGGMETNWDSHISMKTRSRGKKGMGRKENRAQVQHIKGRVGILENLKRRGRTSAAV